MARPKKYGLDYFPLDCDFLSDEKVIAVKVNCGADGVAVAIALLCTIYRNGYYAPWNDCTALKIANDLPGVTPDEVCKVVETMVKYGFFDTDTFNAESVLTSRAIQRRYMTGKRSVKNFTELPHWLISDAKIGVSAAETPENAAEMPPKKSKVKKSKESTTPEVVVDETPPPTTPNESNSVSGSKHTATLAGVDAEIEALADDDLWLDHMQLQVHMSKDQIKALMPEFALHCHTTAKDRHDDIADCKRHFRYWLGRRQYSQTQKTQNPQNNGNADFKQTDDGPGTYKSNAGNTRSRIRRAPGFGLKGD